MSMSFPSRIKKAMTEGIVRATLEDAHYRVIDSGIEKVLRELSCLNSVEYAALGYPDAMSHLPDFTQSTRWRGFWSNRAAIFVRAYIPVRSGTWC
jgi:hypothetical protein